MTAPTAHAMSEKDRPLDGHDLPEVAQQQDHTGKMLYTPDHSFPEVNSHSQYSDRQQHYSATTPYQQTPSTYAAYYAPLPEDEKHTPPPKPQRKILGLTKKAFVIVLAIILFIILLALGLGLGLGLGLHKSSSSGSAAAGTSSSGDSDSSGAGGTNGTANSTNNVPAMPLQVSRNTGLAATGRGDGAGMLMYYQLSNGSVVEEFHAKAGLSATSFTAPVGTEKQIIPLAGYAQNSPLSATSFYANGSLWKHLFYYDTTGMVRLTNNSGKTPDVWTTGSVLGGPVISGSIGLTSCYSDYRGSSLHVFFGDSTGAPNEYFHPFNGSSWTRGSRMGYGSTLSGIACGVYKQDNAKRVVLFMRNWNNVTLLHQFRGVDPEGYWLFWYETRIGNDPNMNMGNTTDLTLTSNADASVSFLFWRGNDGRVRQANLPPNANGTSSTYAIWDSGVRVTNGSKMRSYWPDTSPDGPVVLYQTNETQVQASSVNWNAVVLANGTLGQ